MTREEVQKFLDGHGQRLKDVSIALTEEVNRAADFFASKEARQFVNTRALIDHLTTGLELAVGTVPLATTWYALDKSAQNGPESPAETETQAGIPVEAVAPAEGGKAQESEEV